MPLALLTVFERLSRHPRCAEVHRPRTGIHSAVDNGYRPGHFYTLYGSNGVLEMIRLENVRRNEHYDLKTIPMSIFWQVPQYFLIVCARVFTFIGDWSGPVLCDEKHRYNTALVCHRWRFLACHPQLWLRVDRSVKDLSQPGVYPNIEMAVSAARPGDTILVAAGGSHRVSNIKIEKPLCLIGAGESPDDTTLICSRSSDSALELMSTCKLANLTVRAELGCCLLHRSGRLTIDGCILQCESNPLDHLSYAIISTAGAPEVVSSALKTCISSVSVLRTRIEGGAKAVLTSGTLSLQRVRVIYTRTSLFFWFEVEGGDKNTVQSASVALPIS